MTKHSVTSIGTVLFLACFSAGAGVDKSGVKPEVLSLPSGPGSIEGLGESFEPQLNTGTATYRVPLGTPPGRAGFGPELALSYNSGNGNGPFGLGWRLDFPSIQRQTDKGQPFYTQYPTGDSVDNDRDGTTDEYDEFDTFIYSGGEELVPTIEGWRCENESEFVKVSFASGFWTAKRRDGVTLQFGTTAASRVQQDANTVFAWYLDTLIDANGNSISLVYEKRDTGAQVYCRRIEYNVSGSQKMEVVFSYSERPDIVTDFRPGFELCTAHRCDAIEMRESGTRVRGYRLDYTSTSDRQSLSLLARVTHVGRDGITTLPPASFTYTSFVGDTATPVEMTLAPVTDLDNGNLDLLDINADGLPDILDTSQIPHYYALNKGKNNQGQIEWQGMTPMDTAPSVYLSSDTAKLADVDGDGKTELLDLYSAEVRFYGVDASLSWQHKGDILDAPFEFSDPQVRLLDCNNDKLTDVMQTAGSENFLWINLAGGRWSNRYTVPSPDDQLQFNRDTTKLADMNGDRIQDLVFLENETCYYYPGMGYGRYGNKVTFDYVPNDITDNARLFLADVNGDGLADAVYVGDTLRMWLSLGLNPVNPDRARFTDPISFTTSLLNNFSNFRQADMNGNGSTDIVWNTDYDTLAYLDFTGAEQPYQLKTITNGIGLTTTITYGSSVDEMVRDRQAGNSWTQWAPFPLPVIVRVEAYDGVNPAYVTEIQYHNAYYSGKEREFRGFAAAKRIERGDSSSPDLVTAYEYDTGEAVEALKGTLQFQEARTLDGTVFYREELAWKVRKLLDAITGDSRDVNFAYQEGRTRDILEQGSGTPVQLSWEYAYDNYGNMIRQVDYGRADGTWDDERVTEIVYTAADPTGLSAWILNKVVTQTTADENGTIAAQKRNYYDEQSLGKINQRGNLTQVEDWVTGGQYVVTVSNDYDDYGNIIRTKDALYGTEPGHYRELVYDDVFHTFPVTEIIYTGNPASPLVMRAAYDYGFGVMTSSTEYNGYTSTYGYDTFGRLTSMTKPPDTEHTTEYDYVLAHGLGGGQIINWVETRQRNNTSADGWLRSRTYHDGLGRKVMTRMDGEDAGQVVVSDTVIFNARKQPWKKYLPYFEAGGLNYVDPTYNSGCTTHYYDALGREIRMDQPDGTFSQTVYKPLEKIVYNEEQTNITSPHYGCGMRYVEDGLQDKDGKGRLREVYEGVKLTSMGEPGPLTWWPTRYRYDLLDNLTGYTDSQNNQKFIEYDGLGRKTFMNDPDRGQMNYEYDDADNLIRTVDAKGQSIRYSYDGVNRLLAEYYGENMTTPDVEYHYDTPAGPVALGEFWTPTQEQEIRQAIIDDSGMVSDTLDMNNDDKVDVADAVMAARSAKMKAQVTELAKNTRGQLAWVRDLSGEEHNSYDARGRVAWTIKRIQNTGSDDLRNFYTGYAYNSMDRITTLTYPDQTQATYTYNARGLLEAIPNVVTQVDYNPAGQNARLDYDCGTSSTYSYDNRLRLSILHTVRSRDNIVLQDLNYTYDGVSNITAITDGRAEKDYQSIGTDLGITLEESKKFDNTQTFAYDSLYRLTRSSNPTVYGTITHRYDPIGNMVLQNADLKEPDPLMNLGAMTSGGIGGTSNRIGRGPAAPPGPHAITGTENGSDGAMVFAYDANGNMTSDSGMTMNWDYKDRLKGITKGSTVADYLYDYTDSRKRKSTQGEPDKTVFYVDKNSEIWGDRLLKYVCTGANRIARMDSAYSLQSSDFSFTPSALFLHDHLGSTNLSLMANGSIEIQETYYPYGHDRVDNSSTQGQQGIQYTFSGKEKDIPSDFYYFGTRYYAAAYLNFISIDPLVVDMPRKWLASPQRLNPYIYVNGRPTTYQDPQGKALFHFAMFFAGGGADLARQTLIEKKSLSQVDYFSVVLSAASATLNPVGEFSTIAQIGFAAIKGQILPSAIQASARSISHLGTRYYGMDKKTSDSIVAAGDTLANFTKIGKSFIKFDDASGKIETLVRATQLGKHISGMSGKINTLTNSLSPINSHNVSTEGRGPQSGVGIYTNVDFTTGEYSSNHIVNSETGETVGVSNHMMPAKEPTSN